MKTIAALIIVLPIFALATLLGAAFAFCSAGALDCHLSLFVN